MNTDKIEKIIEKIIAESVSETGKEYRVTKSLPATKEEIAEHKAMLSEAMKVFKTIKETEVRRNRFWAKIQVRLDSFGKSDKLVFNSDTGEIEFREEIK